MGNFNLKSGIFRCQNCYSIYKIKIILGYPDSYANLHCKCSTSRTTIKAFLAELTKGPKMKIICSQCQKRDEKNFSYCHDCNHIYCSTCIKNTHSTHKYISIAKSDFYCVFHQKENFSHFCKDCEMNLCQKCLDKNNKKHLNHDIVEFEKILLTKSERDFLKGKYNLVEGKLNFNNELAILISKKMKKKEEVEQILNLEKHNTEQNKLILELIKFFSYLYDTSKLKNYNIIVNFTENINLNVNKLELWDSNAKFEEVIKKIEKYFKKDYIIVSDYIQEDAGESEKNSNNFQNKNKQLNNNINVKEKVKNKSSSISNKSQKDFGNQNIDKKDNNKTNKIINNKKQNEDKSKDTTNIKENKLTKTNNSNNNIKIKNNEIVNNNNNDKKKEISQNYKITEKKINKEQKENTIAIKETKKLKEAINEKQKELKKEIQKEIKEMPREKIEKESEKQIQKEILKEIKEIPKKIKKEKEKKIQKEITKNEIENNNEINTIQNKENKYANLLSINRFRCRLNSPINLMMVNGLYNKKIFEINIG